MKKATQHIMANIPTDYSIAFDMHATVKFHFRLTQSQMLKELKC